MFGTVGCLSAETDDVPVVERFLRWRSVSERFFLASIGVLALICQ